jgi:hypothetical protein
MKWSFLPFVCLSLTCGRCVGEQLLLGRCDPDRDEFFADIVVAVGPVGTRSDPLHSIPLLVLHAGAPGSEGRQVSESEHACPSCNMAGFGSGGAGRSTSHPRIMSRSRESRESGRRNGWTGLGPVLVFNRPFVFRALRHLGAFTIQLPLILHSADRSFS